MVQNEQLAQGMQENPVLPDENIFPEGLLDENNQQFLDENNQQLSAHVAIVEKQHNFPDEHEFFEDLLAGNDQQVPGPALQNYIQLEKALMNFGGPDQTGSQAVNAEASRL